MLVDDACSIYEHRPRTCRAYDCRVFPASGVAPDDDKPLIARQVRRWRFGIGTPAEQVAHDATRAAAVFLRERPGLLPTGVAPRHATQLAGTAVDVHAAFVGHHAVTGEPKVVDPSPEVVAAAVLRGTTRPR